MLRKSSLILGFIGAVGGGFLGWITRPLAPSFSIITSANPQQAFLLSIAGHVFLYAAIGFVAFAVVHHLVSGSKTQ